MFSSCLVVVVVGNKLVGGSGTVFRECYEAGRIEIFNLDASPLTRLLVSGRVVELPTRCLKPIANLNLPNIVKPVYYLTGRWWLFYLDDNIRCQSNNDSKISNSKNSEDCKGN